MVLFRRHCKLAAVKDHFAEIPMSHCLQLLFSVIISMPLMMMMMNDELLIDYFGPSPMHYLTSFCPTLLFVFIASTAGGMQTIYVIGKH